MVKVGDRVPELLEQARGRLSRGQPWEAMQIYQQLLHETGPTAWFHYDLGNCYNELRNPHLARYHLAIAQQEVSDYKVAVQMARAESAIGNSEAVFDLFRRNINDPRFCRAALPYLVSVQHGARMLRFMAENLEPLAGVLAADDRWLQFLRGNAASLMKTEVGPDNDGLSFSPTFPMSLLMLEGGSLEKVLGARTSRHVRFVATSWNLLEQLNSPSVKSYVNRAMPHWLLERLAAEDVDFVFDSSEEAPRINEAGLATWRRSVSGTKADACRLLILTANSITPRPMTDVTVAEVNVYPILAATGASGEAVSVGSASPTRTFTLMNGVPRPHRCALMVLLEREGLLDDVAYSWWGQANQKTMRDTLSYITVMKDQLGGLAISDQEIDWLMALPTVTVEADTSGSNTHFLCDSTPVAFLRSAKYHVVSETEFVLSAGTLRMTEKSMKPLVAGVPFVSVGVPLLVSHMREQGFDVLDDYIDHAYDAIGGHSERLLALVSEMKRLKTVQIPAERLLSMAQANRSRLQVWAREKKADYAAAIVDWICDRSDA